MSAQRRAHEHASRAHLLVVAAAILLLGFWSTLPRAHEGHDHGTPVGAADSLSPRVVATSEHYQFVGIVEGEVLVIYLDRAPDNAPVTTATLEVAVDGTAHKAELLKGGTYEITAPQLKLPGTHEVLVTLADGAVNDLLIGTVVIPASAQARSDRPPALSRTSVILVGVVLVLGLLTGHALPRRMTIALAIAIGALLVGTTAFAHEGHDHGPDMTASTGNSPARRPDGTIFLPKPSQRLLEVRTRTLESTTRRRAARMTGRIVANPNFSGVVQSTIQGRYQAPPGGVPALGLRVASGDLLGSVTPSFASIDASDMSQRLGEIDQQISLMRSKLSRLEPLLASKAVAHATVDEARIQLEGLLQRRHELLAARVRAEELRAPVAGVIAAVRVMSGQVVSQTDQIFQVINPSELLVEGLVFDQIDPDAIVEADAIVGDGHPMPLRYVGRSRTLQQQHALVQFKIEGAVGSLNVGTPVTIVARSGEPVAGLFLPRAAVAQAPNGQHVVFIHKEPELFVPVAVRTEPFDAHSVLVLGGVKAGDKIVVQNAPLINQVR